MDLMPFFDWFQINGGHRRTLLKEASNQVTADEASSAGNQSRPPKDLVHREIDHRSDSSLPCGTMDGDDAFSWELHLAARIATGRGSRVSGGASWMSSLR